MNYSESNKELLVLVGGKLWKLIGVLGWIALGVLSARPF